MSFNHSSIIRPHRLHAGDTIGIVAPSGPFDRESFEKGVAVIQNMGFATKTDPRIFTREGYLAGIDASRAAQVNAMVADTEVKAVICARGGYGSLRILEALDYAAIGSSAKAIIGFSDITALHRAILLRASLVTLHGPMVTTLPNCDEKSRTSWYRAITEPVVPAMDLSHTRILKPGTTEGVLTGGNLATLCHLTGTSLGAGYKGQILLVEEVGEAPYRIDRMLTQMKMAGLFAGLAGLVLGSFEDCGSTEEIDALVQERFADMSIPIVSGVRVGHGRSNWTVPLGAAVRLDTTAGELRFLEPTFRE
jgi:muramoyltetrapeptide carboxypeptidase